MGGLSQVPGPRAGAAAAADMVHRSFAGPIVNVFAVAVILFATDLYGQHRTATALFTAILAVRLLGRVGFRLYRRTSPDRSAPPVWLIGLSAYTLSVPAGCYAAFIVLRHGYEHWNTVLMYLFAMVCAISGTTSLAPDLRLGLWYQGTLLLPIVVASLWTGGRHSWVGVAATILCAGYAVIQAIRENTDYRNAKAASATLQHRAEELEAAQAAALAASQAKSRFLATMSHEIRTPMNGVLGMLDVVLRNDLPEGQRQDLVCARESAQSLLVLLNNILDQAKAEAGRLELEQTDFSVREVVASALAPFRLQAEGKGIELNCVIEPCVPARLNGDPTRLRQILINLISNALRFTEKGFVAVAVTLDAMAGAETVLRFLVADSGLGIPADKRDIVFDAFSQADGSITRRFGGTGLGLAICRDLVRLMGGQIWVESEVGRGSIFRFTAKFATASSASKETKPAQSPAPSARALRVLVAEDNAVNRKILARVLETGGHSLAVAEDGRQAVATFSQCQFDLVLMDVQMPGMDGLQATREIRAAGGKRVPIIGVTAGATSAELAACLDAGMDACITKPIAIADLQELLARVGKASS